MDDYIALCIVIESGRLLLYFCVEVSPLSSGGFILAKSLIFPASVNLDWFLSSSSAEPGGTPVSIYLCYCKPAEEGDRLNTNGPFLSWVLFPSNSGHMWVCHSPLWFGSWVFWSWGGAVFLSPFSLYWCISTGLARIYSAAALGLLPRQGNAQKWCPGCVVLAKRSREQFPLQRLQSEKLHHPFFF